MKKIQISINGCEKQVVVNKEMVLLDLLREHFHLTGAKQSCDRKGQCGACTVIVNGKAVLSCLTKVMSLDGAQVISVEGGRDSRQSQSHPEGIRSVRSYTVRLLHPWNDYGDEGITG